MILLTIGDAQTSEINLVTSNPPTVCPQSNLSFGQKCGLCSFNSPYFCEFCFLQGSLKTEVKREGFGCSDISGSFISLSYLGTVTTANGDKLPLNIFFHNKKEQV